MLSKDNNIKSITVLVKNKDLTTIKAILKFLSEKYSSFSVKKFRTGKIGEDLIVSFKLDHEFYPIILEKFAYNDINLIMRDKRSLDFIDEKKEQKRRKLRAHGWSEISVKKRQPSICDLIKNAKAGKLKEIAKEAKGGVGSDIEIVNKAKSLLSETIRVAINNLVNYAFDRLGQRQHAIDELILIAIDKDLKLLNKQDEMNEAGLAAIELSRSHNIYYKNIINIANNSKLNNLVNIRATIAFSDLFNNCPEAQLEKLPNPVKLLNTRWLKIAFETVQSKLEQQEIDKFNSFVEFIEQQRDAA